MNWNRIKNLNRRILVSWLRPAHLNFNKGERWKLYVGVGSKYVIINGHHRYMHNYNESFDNALIGNLIARTSKWNQIYTSGTLFAQRWRHGVYISRRREAK